MFRLLIKGSKDLAKEGILIIAKLKGVLKLYRYLNINCDYSIGAIKAYIL